MKEIERKFLVKEGTYERLKNQKFYLIKQGYISDQDGKVVRVRTTEFSNDQRAYLTIKGPTTGITRDEYEFMIPFEEGQELLSKFCPAVLEKHRYRIYCDKNKRLLDVDFFQGKLSGLAIVEIELKNEKTEVIKPDWFGEEVSFDSSYFNSNLIKRI